MTKLKFLLVFLCCFGLKTYAQVSYSLEDCIGLAIQNDYDLKNQNSQVQISERIYRQSKLEKYPSLSTGFSHGLNLGRSIDPFSNQIADGMLNFAQFGLSSEVTLFDGKITKNTSRLRRGNKAISELESENFKLELRKDVTLAYLEVILKQELLMLKKEQKELVQIQLDRIALMDITEEKIDSVSIDAIAQLENENYQIIQAGSDLEIARIRLLALMNLRSDTDFVLEAPLVANALESSMDNRGDNILNLSFLKQKELEIQQSSLNLSIKEGARKPHVFFNGGLYSVYSSEADTKINVLDSNPMEFLQESQTEFVQIENENIPLNRLVSQPNVEEVKVGYFSQLFSNYGLSFSLNFQYPIYDRHSRNTGIQVAKIEKIIAQNDFKKVQSQIQNELTEIKTLIYSSEDKYLQALKQEDAQAKAFGLSEKRFEEGLMTFAEFNQAKISLENAKLNILQNRYTHYFYNLIYGYYTGK